ncbi:MAG: glycosyltransferase family 39 protein [Leptospiraceae bacterium]|nr:glycosyltransferase family 39 protein [Leptospiraceae bacterium]
MIRFSRTVSFAFPAILALFIQLQFFGASQPPPWPDEALFSNPAAELARGNGFRTEVLHGLVPGMENATLWNSPLYMVGLSGIYRITGESLTAGRLFSAFIAVAVLLLLTWMLQNLQTDRAFLFLAPLVLALDPAFVRGANVLRMDGLCLFFCMLSLHFAMQAFRKKDQYSFLSGVALGLAALSHPAALYGVVFVLLFHLFRWRGLFFAFCGLLLAMSPWLAYIAEHPHIFQVQFVSQLMRKSGLLSLWGGPTGGMFVVFTSQFGGGFLSMLLVSGLCAIAGLLLIRLWMYLLKIARSEIDATDASTLESGQENGPLPGGWFSVLLQQLRSNSLFLLSLCWPLVTAFILLSVEGWYAMHSFPYLILSTAAFLSLPYRKETLRNQATFLFRILAIGLIALSGLSAFRQLAARSPEVVRNALHTMTDYTADCKSVYARMVPDPYFAILRARPATKYFEFVPARLSFPTNQVDPVRVYDQIDCFILERSGKQDGPVDQYLDHRMDQFLRIPLAFSPPAASGELFIRREKD